MLISFSCPKCKAKLEVEADAVGSQVPCPQCASVVTIPARPLGPGVTIGGFKIKKLLGRGAMGEVYLAYQVSMDRDVALKILPPEFTRDKDAVELFLHEVRLQAKLEHPNIVTAHESGEDGGVYFLAMAYVGESLASRLERVRSIPEQEALQIVHKLAGALDYAWREHRLLHRDIKPANIVMDAHGDPRLTDLGLSRSLRHSGIQVSDGWVVGTPNYMSPEQGAGNVEIDFRSDMYSLGATLYHMVTGSLPFDGVPPEDVFEKQASEPLTDPRDLNPDVSDACVELLALMLAMERDDRHPSWSALIGDIERVMAGEHPLKKPLGPGESAMLRVRAMGGSPMDQKKIVLRHSQVRKLHDRTVEPSRKSESWLPVAGVVLLLAAVAAGLVVVWRVVTGERARAPIPEETSQAVQQESAEDARASALEKKLAEAARYEREHPDDFAGVIRWFEAIRSEGQGTEYEIRAENELRRLDAARKQVLEAVIAGLTAEAGQLQQEGKPEEAAALLLDYKGPHADDTLEKRKELAEEIVRRDEEAKRALREKTERAQSRLNDLLRSVAADVLKSDFAQAMMRLDAAESEGEWQSVEPELQALRKQVGKVSEMPRVILDSFRGDQGREIRVLFSTGPQLLKIGLVGQDGRVRAQRHFEGAGYAQRDFVIEELGFQERFDRLGKEASPELDIMRGLLLNQWQKTSAAKVFFARAGSSLGRELAEQVDQRLADAREVEAEKTFAGLLRLVGLPPATEATEEVVRGIRRTPYPAADVARIRDAASRFNKVYGDSETAKRAEALLQALERVDTVPREVDPAILEQAVQRLRMDNPQVTELLFMHDVSAEGIEMDLSNNPELSNIAALERLPLTKLNLSKTKVVDLTALRMMPLRTLDLSGCPVDDIQILAGMPLEELNLSGCKVRTVRPLKGAPLRVLNLSGNPVNVVTGLSDMPLVKLDLGSCPITDVRPLRPLPLEWLSLWKTRIVDLKALKGMQLKWLMVAGTAVTDLSPLEGMPLESLVISGTGVSDLTPVKTLPLRELVADHCGALADLGPLGGMPLTHLYFARTKVTDLSPLKGMPLKALNITGVAFADMSPLRGMSTLEVLVWDRWDQMRIMAPVAQAVEAGRFDDAAQAALKLAGDVEGVPALVPTVNLLRVFAEKRIPDLKGAAAAPQNIRALAKTFNGKDYALAPRYADFDGAVAFSRSVGGTLASVASKEEMDWIIANFALPGMPIRLGGTDAKKEGDWQWVGGAPWKFTAWMPVQPDNNRGTQHSLITFSDGKWDDIESGFACPFLVMW
ncbi:MAG: Serine/threonine-protein kinase PrkC [Verrucomicrobia bacterium ADurb.Bin345]|nr:MAG: Serine/threonine-protein kinase PrkC [Verrucomicrobia bacterium ADurb.Bin345]